MANKSFWDKTANFYTHFMKNNDKVYRITADKISQHLEKNMSVLELAFGTGQFTSLLFSHVSTWVATDFSSNMIENAKKNFSNLDIDFKTLDATNTNYPDKSFDAVLIANALHIMPNSNKALQEILRILKPSGLLFAPTFIYDENIPKLRLWFLEKLGFQTYNKWKKDEFEKFVLDNGFSVISSETISAKPLSECVLIARKNK